MKRTIGYGRGVLFLLLAAVFLLTACQTKEKQQVSLDTNSQTLKIKGVAYDISNKEVSEDAIQKLAYRFKAYLVLDSDNKLLACLSDIFSFIKASCTSSVNFNNLTLFATVDCDIPNLFANCS